MAQKIEFFTKHGDGNGQWPDMIDREMAEASVGMFGRWLTRKGIDTSTLSDEDLCRTVVDFWNDTCHAGEPHREFIRLKEATDGA